MRLRARWLFLPLVVAAVAVAGCADKAAPVPTAPGAVPSLSAAASAPAGCYAVRFHADGTYHYGVDPVGVYHVTLSGDLEGTMVMTFDRWQYAGPPLYMSHGVNFFEGTASWNVTGGVVPGLTAFQADIRIQCLLRDDQHSPATVFENIGTQWATSGVTRANLSFKGTATDDWVAGTQTGSHAYEGVICP